jgi:hypothetical protein
MAYSMKTPHVAVTSNAPINAVFLTPKILFNLNPVKRFLFPIGTDSNDPAHHAVRLDEDFIVHFQATSVGEQLASLREPAGRIMADS